MVIFHSYVSSPEGNRHHSAMALSAAECAGDEPSERFMVAFALACDEPPFTCGNYDGWCSMKSH